MRVPIKPGEDLRYQAAQTLHAPLRHHRIALLRSSRHQQTTHLIDNRCCVSDNVVSNLSWVSSHREPNITAGYTVIALGNTHATLRDAC